MKSSIFETAELMSQAAADHLANRIQAVPDLLLCAASGNSPTRTYQILAQKRAAFPRLFDRLRVLKLDEWGGVPMQDPCTCERYLRRELVEPTGTVDRYVGFRSDPPDPDQECRRVAQWLETHGPISICVLGLGINGHIAFNEPARFLRPHPHVATLAQSSLQHSMLQTSAGRPSYGLTLGMADLLCSEEILLLVQGASKREPLEWLLRREIAPDFPASFLWLHPNVRLFCDRSAAP